MRVSNLNATAFNRRKWQEKTFGTQQLSQAGGISQQNAVNSQLETRVCQTQQKLDL